MEKTIKFKAIGSYNGHSVRNNNSVDLTLKFNYDELTNSIKLIQLLNENIHIGIKIEDGKPFKLGVFMIKSLTIDHDGQVTAKFNSQVDYLELDNFRYMVGKLLNVMFKSSIDIEEDAEEEEIEKWAK